MKTPSKTPKTPTTFEEEVAENVVKALKAVMNDKDAMKVLAYSKMIFPAVMKQVNEAHSDGWIKGHEEALASRDAEVENIIKGLIEDIEIAKTCRGCSESLANAQQYVLRRLIALLKSRSKPAPSKGCGRIWNNPECGTEGWKCPSCRAKEKKK